MLLLFSFAVDKFLGENNLKSCKSFLLQVSSTTFIIFLVDLTCNNVLFSLSVKQLQNKYKILEGYSKNQDFPVECLKGTSLLNNQYCLLIL